MKEITQSVDVKIVREYQYRFPVTVTVADDASEDEVQDQIFESASMMYFDQEPEFILTLHYDAELSEEQKVSHG